VITVHLVDGEIPEEYMRYVGRKVTFIAGGIGILLILFIASVSVGAVQIPPAEVVQTIVSGAITRINAFLPVDLPVWESASLKWEIIIWNIRLPQALTAVFAGVGLSVAGVAMQSVLRNPLGSPFTLGISNAAAFGAAFSVIVLGAGTMHSSGVDAVVIDNPYITTTVAFFFSMVATAIILAISRLRGASPEVMVLAGVALASLFTAGTSFLQYFADDVQLAAVVFWSFGDVGRADWSEFMLIAGVTIISVLYFCFNRWNYNAIDAGDETAKGLGVKVEQVRLVGMLVSSLVTAVIISFLGVIGFVGLVCPHIVRRLIGDDHRFLVPGSCIAGAVLLLAADTVARIILAPHILPVAILTAFMGAPVFIYLLIRGYRR
jgi:iron complex transport system permease protein